MKSVVSKKLEFVENVELKAKISFMSRLKDLYQNEIVPKLQKELGLKNSYQAPKAEKVVLGMGVGKAVEDKNLLEKATEDLRNIAGQQPVATVARSAISGFKIRQGNQIGLKVTLRGERMYEFLDKLFNIVLPRTRDFRGLSGGAFDGGGNYSIGLTEQVAFPEINPAKIDRLRGLQVTVATNAKNDASARRLLVELGLPLEKQYGEKSFN